MSDQWDRSKLAPIGEDPVLHKELLHEKEQFEREFFDPKWEAMEPTGLLRMLATGDPETFANIVGFGVGPKISRGRPTGEPSVRVYVVQKIADVGRQESE